jgi:RNA polymerase subunit RPABC4/transcription elongation factor Spt4
MPRGGGGMRGGGGFRGGGFGGGFRGGGFRGGPSSFRMPRGTPSGTPFGRTGATRITSRSPSGPYRHSYYRPYRSYYRWGYWGYRPWYYRWWYSPYWIGHWYRPWYYSPVYVGGGIVFAIILGLILLPLFGVALWFPFSSADANGYVNYRSTETIYYNEYWYEYEYIEAGNQITYSVQSSPEVISFAIWNQPFETIPKTTIEDGFADSFTLLNNYYEYYSVYLKPGSSIDYNFNSTSSVDFFIADANQLYNWNQGGSPTFYYELNGVTTDTGGISISSAKDYYLVWFNGYGSSAYVEFIANFTAVDVYDLTAAYESHIAVTTITQDTFTVPADGNWYFFVYFDPLNSPAESTDITFDVTYDTGINGADRWVSISPILIGILVVIVIILIAAIVARSGQKKMSKKQPKEAQQAQIKTIPGKKEAVSESKCIRCGNSLRPDANFCPVCGGKVEGRTIGTSDIITPADSKTCSLCGSKLEENAKFCKWCGTQVEKEI